jgi:hypothetical protein
LTDVDAYESDQAENEGEATIDEMYDDKYDGAGKCDDDYVPDAVLLAYQPLNSQAHVLYP